MSMFLAAPSSISRAFGGTVGTGTVDAHGVDFWSLEVKGSDVFLREYRTPKMAETYKGKDLYIDLL